MRYKLLISHKGWWKQIDASNDYVAILGRAYKLDSENEWMIVTVNAQSEKEDDSDNIEPLPPFKNVIDSLKS